MSRMRIAVTLTVEIDTEKWDPFATDVELRRDVKRYVQNAVAESTAMQDADAEVVLR